MARPAGTNGRVFALNFRDTLMIDRLNDYDWQEAFGYAGEPNTSASDGNHPEAVLGSCVSAEPFTREDVAEIIAIVDGENDGENWVGVFLLKDGRFASVDAGCDYTGWDCQADGTARVAETLDQIIRLGLTEHERERLGLQV